MMPRERLTLESLPAWISLNNVTFSKVEIQPVQHKGHGLIARAASAEIGQTPLVTIPHDLVLNAEAVEAYAKADGNFRTLIDSCGHKSPRHDVLLFLLVQLVLASRQSGRVALSTPWTEYIKMLDDGVPVPTLWTEDERLLLRGTSLEPALNAKMLALAREFDDIREKSSEIECWNSAFWENRTIHLTDWYRLDAWYRSRVLELPVSGPSMVPCIDMANHSVDANARYDENSQDDVVLLLCDGSQVTEEQEITISYGSEKSAAEMLFSYGFLDVSSAARSLTLPLGPLPGDPLGKAKAHVFPGSPSVRLRQVDGNMEWTSPFAYLMCLNQEDGLAFKVLQSSDASEELRIFWQEEDVTDRVISFGTLIAEHHLRDVFRLRVNVVVSQRLEEQLQQLCESLEVDVADKNDSFNAINAQELKQIERDIINETLATLEGQRSQLLEMESVTTYLESVQTGADAQVTTEEDNAEDDFS